MKIQSRAKGPRVRRARAVKCHTSRDGLSEVGNSHTKRYGQSARGGSRKKRAWGTLAALRLSVCIRRNLFCIDHFPFHFPSSISSISLSLSLSEPLQLVCGRRWLTERLIFRTISSPAKRPEELWTDKGIFRDFNSYVPFLWALFR